MSESVKVASVPSQHQIRVLIVDDQRLMSRALEAFVNEAPDLVSVGRADDGLKALEMVMELQPDVVLMDMKMSGMDGVETTRHIGVLAPGVKVIAVTMFSAQRYLVPALRAGVAGFLLKDATAEEVAEAVREVHFGGAVLAPPVLQHLIDTVVEEGQDADVDPAGDLELLKSQLTARELAVLKLLSQGCTNAEMTTLLHVSQATVKTHMRSLMRKLGARDRVQVLLVAARNGLIRLS